MFRKARRDGFESEIWDTKTKKTMIVTFVFFATGMLLAWQFGQIPVSYTHLTLPTN